jgi:DNA-binding response OmpR family regulator
MTAYGYEESYKYFEAGMDDYFCKPFSAEKLKLALAN